MDQSKKEKDLRKLKLFSDIQAKRIESVRNARLKFLHELTTPPPDLNPADAATRAASIKAMTDVMKKRNNTPTSKRGKMTTEPIESMGQITAIGMRVKVADKSALTINTCSGNGTDNRGTPKSWIWCNPTNTAVTIKHPGTPFITAVSPECMWQGTKIIPGGAGVDQEVLKGKWKKNKSKKPRGAFYTAEDELITDPGVARRKIYIPSYRQLIEFWMKDDIVAEWVDTALSHDGPVYLRDFDVGRGIDTDVPMSHAWLLAEFLNTGKWPK